MVAETMPCGMGVVAKVQHGRDDEVGQILPKPGYLLVGDSQLYSIPSSLLKFGGKRQITADTPPGSQYRRCAR